MNVVWPAAILVLASSLAAAGQQPEAFVRASSLPQRPAASEAVVRERLVEVASPARLRDPNASREMVLDLFPDLRLRAVRTDWSVIPGGATWTGELDGYPGSRAVFATVDGEVVGHISASFGYFTLRRGADGLYVVQQIDPSAMGPRLDDSVLAGDVEGADAGHTEDTRIQPRLDTGATIDVMAVITRDAVVGFGSEATARATVQVAIAETSEALRASGVPTALRLVHVEIVDHPESKDSGLELRRLQNPSDGVLDEVHALRDVHAADLVVLVLESFTQNLGGQAYVNALTSRGSWGFSVVRRRAIDEERIFAHEIGHNLGAAHDWYVTSAPGAFSYAKGYTSLQGRLLDIMSYWDLCRDTNTDCSQLLVYSNPRVSHQGVLMGVPVGTSTACRPGVRPDVACDADAASVVARMATTVSRFRNSRLALSSRRLKPGDSSRSANGRFRLTYQTDGNLVLVDTVDGRQMWATETGGTTPGEVSMQPDGDFTVTDAAGNVRWSANTGRNPNAYFVVQDDGVLVVLRADGQPLWGSNAGRVTPPPVAPGPDALSITSITPARGATVTAGETIQFSATIRYSFTSSDVGEIVVLMEDAARQRIEPVTAEATGSDRVSIGTGTGEVTLQQTIVVPASVGSSVRVWVLASPVHSDVWSAAASVTYPIQ